MKWIVGIHDERLKYGDFYGPFDSIDEADDFVKKNFPHMIDRYILGRFKGEINDKRIDQIVNDYCPACDSTTRHQIVADEMFEYAIRCLVCQTIFEAIPPEQDDDV